jgi:Fe-S-cluster containining protein
MDDISESSNEALDEYVQEWLDTMLETYGEIFQDWNENNIVQPYPDAQTHFECNQCGKCCEFTDYWVWVYPSDILMWMKDLDNDKIVPLLLSILFPVEDLDGIQGFGLPSQKMIVEKFNEIVEKDPPSGVIRKTFKAIIDQLHIINPSFDNRSEFCIFYNSRSPDHCSIYNHRPVQCKCYPFDYPNFTKIDIPEQLCDKYGCNDDDEEDLPLCPEDSFDGDLHNGVETTEEQRKIVTMEKANFLCSTVMQDMMEEDISDALLERYHEDVLNLERETLFVKKEHTNPEVQKKSKFIEGKRPDKYLAYSRHKKANPNNKKGPN